MPCNADYMESTNLEKNLSGVMNLIDEVITGEPVDPKKYNDGYDPRVYCKGLGQEHLDVKVEELCSRLQSFSEEEIKSFSLELQTWWRDHQEADRLRLEKEHRELLDDEARKKALSKLKPYERKLLNLQDEI